MDTARYVVGILLAVGTPPAILFWIFIHPLARQWRRAGPLATYLTTGVVCALMGWGIFLFRREILGPDLGTNGVLLAPAAVFYLLSAWISLQAKRHLKIQIFAGVPEVSQGGGTGVLLQEGIYGIIRHPRYVAVVIGTAGVALFVNYLGTYILVLASIPALYLVVVLEERELAERFGLPYLEYRSRVPAFVPRFGRRERARGP
jgi:protein-S-isoprenylcysteine O-methyltransferase Ste14